MATSEEKKPLIVIAMKGHPGTGKSTLAHALASTLKLAHLDKDDIYEPGRLHLRQHYDSLSNHLNELCYEALWQLAATQLRNGLGVIIDTPFATRTRLDRLLGVAESAGARLVIVECRPSDEAKWRERLEGREYRPLAWEELEKRIKFYYGGCTEYDVGDVPRLVVDTTAPGVGVAELAASVVDFINASSGSS